MKKVLIIGGGLSGISTAVYLSKSGFEIELIEASPKFGGRTYSFNYKNTVIDNGQHVLMECYENTLDYIDTLGVKDLFHFQESLQLNYVTSKKSVIQLNIPKHFYPFNNIVGLLKFKLFSLSERFSILKFLIEIKFIDSSKLSDLTVFGFLKKKKQSENAIINFWENLVVSTMNTPTKIASSQMFVDMLKIIFFKDKRSSNIIIPKVGLSEALVNPALDMLKRGNYKLLTSEKVLSINTSDNKVISIKTNKRNIDDFDYVVSAIPVYALKRILKEYDSNRFKLPKLEYAPIVTVHVWLNENPLTEKMYSLIEGEFDWVFNHGNHITLISSNAKKLAGLNKNIVIKIVFSELKKYFTILSNKVIMDYIVLKETKATFISNHTSAEARKHYENQFSNLYIAGDWTNTGLPATIEGAIKSGYSVAHKLTSKK